MPPPLNQRLTKLFWMPPLLSRMPLRLWLTLPPLKQLLTLLFPIPPLLP
jgi:hypothetical protein